MPNDNAYCVPPVKPLVLSEFSCATPEEIYNIISTSTNSSCLLDAIPTKLLKSCVDVLVEPLTHLINCVLIEGFFPQQFKTASVRPLLKNTICLKMITIAIGQFPICHFLPKFSNVLFSIGSLSIFSLLQCFLLFNRHTESFILLKLHYYEFRMTFYLQ